MNKVEAKAIYQLTKLGKSWTPLNSTMIFQCMYIRASRMFIVQFRKAGALGAIWMYHPVTWSTYMGFHRAKSRGSYFHAEIRDNPKIQSQQLA